MKIFVPYAYEKLLILSYSYAFEFFYVYSYTYKKHSSLFLNFIFGQKYTKMNGNYAFIAFYYSLKCCLYWRNKNGMIMKIPETCPIQNLTENIINIILFAYSLWK